jgi:hypothetical protein
MAKQRQQQPKAAEQPEPAEPQESQGFVIVSESRGVYLGGQRWSGQKGHEEVKRAPVFSKDDPEVLGRKNVGGDARYEPVTVTGGFAERDSLQDFWGGEQQEREQVRGQMGGRTAKRQPAPENEQQPTTNQAPNTEV